MNGATAIKLVEPKNPPADEPLRHDLGVAIEERKAAAAKRDAAADILERSNAFVLELEERLQSVAERDAKAIAEKAEHFKAALIEATTPTLSTSAKLSTAALQRVEAENMAEAARQAHASLAEALQEAEARLTSCEVDVTRKAMAIVGAYADRLAQELKEAEHACSLARRRLLGATQYRPGGQFPLTAATMSVARNDRREEYAHAEGEDVQHFNRFLAALCKDANAQPEGE